MNEEITLTKMQGSLLNYSEGKLKNFPSVWVTFWRDQTGRAWFEVNSLELGIKLLTTDFNRAYDTYQEGVAKLKAMAEEETRKQVAEAFIAVQAEPEPATV